jgi:hypothetical protein
MSISNRGRTQDWQSWSQPRALPERLATVGSNALFPELHQSSVNCAWKRVITK